MKKILIFMLPIILTSCFWPNKDDIQKAKDKLFNNTGSIKTTDIDIKNESVSVWEKSYYKINYIWKERWIDIEPIENIEKIKEKLDIKWIVSNKKIDKIKVIFENKTSKLPTDNYELKTYKKGSEKFLYRAHTAYDVLDLWLNQYTFEWYIWDTLITSLKLDLYIADPSKIIENKWEEKTFNATGSIQSFTWDIFENLPNNDESYGKSTVNNDEWTFTYSNLKDFQWAKNSELSEVNCENFWDYLKQNYTWYYWNTCRPIQDENNFSVNVLSLIGDEYKYEKHYIWAKLWIYGKILLESWTGLSQADLEAKNDELKTKKFDISGNADTLFKDLLR